MAQPKIYPNYLDTDYDQEMMIKGIRLIRQIAGAPALQSVIESELSPGADADSDSQDCKVHQSASMDSFSSMLHLPDGKRSLLLLS